MSLLEMKNIKKSFNGVEVLKDISLTVEKGEVLGIIGPSGSGKTGLRCFGVPRTWRRRTQARFIMKGRLAWYSRVLICSLIIPL